MADAGEPPFTPSKLRDRLVAIADEFGTLMSPRARLEHLAAALFLKRASDVFVEEHAAAVAELGGSSSAEAIIAANPDAFYLLRLPAGATWKDVRGVDRNRFGAK